MAASPTLAILSLITMIVILIVNIRTARKINDDLEVNLVLSQQKIETEQVNGFILKLALKVLKSPGFKGNMWQTAWSKESRACWTRWTDISIDKSGEIRAINKSLN